MFLLTEVNILEAIRSLPTTFTSSGSMMTFTDNRMFSKFRGNVNLRHNRLCSRALFLHARGATTARAVLSFLRLRYRLQPPSFVQNAMVLILYPDAAL